MNTYAIKRKYPIYPTIIKTDTEQIVIIHIDSVVSTHIIETINSVSIKSNKSFHVIILGRNFTLNNSVIKFISHNILLIKLFIRR